MVRESRLAEDMHRFKRERNEAAERLERCREALADTRADLVRELIRGRLLRVEDFGIHIGVDAVTDSTGRVDRQALEARVSDLLRRRPELAAASPSPGGGSAVDW